MAQIMVNVRSKPKPFDHYWKMCVGSGHAALGLRKDWFEHLKYVHDELGFKYVRFHGLLSDDMKIITTAKDVNKYCPKSVKTISFYQVGCVFDNILEAGMKPFIEIGYMPSAIASGNKTTLYYKGNITPPKDYGEWKDLIEKLVKYLIGRYGEKEVESWFFEVWNEPNLKYFWSSTKEEYFKLYKYTAKAIKKVNTKIKVGGPSTADNKWIKDMIKYCKEGNVPLDFVTTHHYPGVPLGHKVSFFDRFRKGYKDMKEAKTKDVHGFFSVMTKDKEKNLTNSPRGKLTKEVIKAKKEAGDLPLIYTEWNSNATLTYEGNDNAYTSAFIVKTIIDNSGLVDGYSFWTFSDIFEELSFFGNKPFSGSFGMLNINGIPKQSFWAFKLLSKLGEERYDISSKTTSETVEIAVFRKNNIIQIMVYNQQMPKCKIFKEEVEIVLTGVDEVSQVTIERINEFNGNPKKAWVEMGSPEYLTKEEIEDIKEKSELKHENLEYYFSDGKLILKTEVQEQEVALIEIK